MTLDDQQAAARTWFEGLRDLICAEFEAIEREAGSDARFAYTPWDRADPSGAPGGGGSAARGGPCSPSIAAIRCRRATRAGADRGADMAVSGSCLKGTLGYMFTIRSINPACQSVAWPL